MKVRLENWSIAGTSLVGRVYSHPRFDDGEIIRTSTIEFLSVEDRLAKAISGTIYELGEPSEQEADYGTTRIDRIA